MKLLLSYLRRYWRLVLLALGLAAVNQIFSLLDPLIFRHVIDQYATRFDQYTTREFVRGVSLLLLAAVGVAFVSRVAKNFQDYFINVVTQRLGAELYSDGIRHSLDLPYQVFEDQRSGETLGKLQKVRADVEKLINVAVNVLFTTLVGIVFVTIYAFTVHWIIAPVYFLTVPLLGWLSSTLSRRIKEVQKVIVAETTALAGATTESLRNIELVKSLGLANQEVARLNGTTEKILRLELKKVRYLRSLSFIQGTCVNALRTGIMFLMLYLIFTREITVGQFFSLFIYSFFIFGPLQELGNVINAFREAEVSLQNFQKILDTPREPKPPAPVLLPELRTLAFAEVVFTHQTASAPALFGISFALGRGETVAFVGPSGAGKTTLVKLLVGLYRPQSGRILYNGHPGDVIDLDSLRERIGFVTQDTQLFAGTIRENLRFVRPDATDEECLEVLRKAACDSLLARADKGLDTLIGEGGVKVSGGEKQRLSIARALLRRPHLLVFDEATSSLDSLTEEEIDRPPSLHRDACGPDLRAGTRPDRRGGTPLRPARAEGPVLRDVAAAGRRAPPALCSRPRDTEAGRGGIAAATISLRPSPRGSGPGLLRATPGPANPAEQARAVTPGRRARARGCARSAGSASRGAPRSSGASPPRRRSPTPCGGPRAPRPPRATGEEAAPCWRVPLPPWSGRPSAGAHGSRAGRPRRPGRSPRSGGPSPPPDSGCGGRRSSPNRRSGTRPRGPSSARGRGAIGGPPREPSRGRLAADRGRRHSARSAPPFPWPRETWGPSFHAGVTDPAVALRTE